jgi:hypothetical protein
MHCRSVRSATCPQPHSAAGQNTSDQPRTHRRNLESVLGATPREFESRILRRLRGPDHESGPALWRSDVHVPGAHPGRSPGLPPHDRVDHDVRDAEDQEHGRGGVASVMKTMWRRPGLPSSRMPTVTRPCLCRPCRSRSTRPHDSPGEPRRPRRHCSVCWLVADCGFVRWVRLSACQYDRFGG